MQSTIADWIAGYRRAWESNDPDDIGALFTLDAVYRTEPYSEPWRGREAIVAGWLEGRDEPGETTFEWEPLVAGDDLAVVQAMTVYLAGHTYHNLWVIRRVPDGRAREFTEWWMRVPADDE